MTLPTHPSLLSPVVYVSEWGEYLAALVYGPKMNGDVIVLDLMVVAPRVGEAHVRVREKLFPLVQFVAVGSVPYSATHAKHSWHWPGETKDGG